MQTDNSTANALLTNKIMPKAFNAQGQFRYYWRPGTQNLADYFTKHHPASHHTAVCLTILTAVTDKEYTKLVVTSPAKAKASATTNFFVQKLLTTPKFHAAAAA